MESIEFTIKGKSVKMEAIGFVGKACEIETDEVQRALGTAVANEYKEEYFRTAKTESKQSAGH